MQVNLTSSATNRASILLYGRPGIGKTVAISRTPKPLILSAEAGLLSLAGTDTPYITIKSIQDLRDTYKWLQQDDNSKPYETICIDSISEICDMSFLECKDAVGTKVPALYSELRSRILPLISGFKKLHKHLVVTARETTKLDDDKHSVKSPGVIGNKLVEDMPYLFDIVLYYYFNRENARMVCTKGGVNHIAKDRTGLLPTFYTDTSYFLMDIIKTILGDNHV